MSTTHTPGPWCQRPDQRFVIAAPMNIHIKPGEPPRHFDDAKAICEVKAPYQGIEESEANARLIAAAPDLYGALKALLSVLPDNWGDAIQDGALPAFHLVAADVDDAFAALAKAEGR